MGAVLEPTEQMTPWYAVEVRRESAYVTAAVYNEAHVRQIAGEGAETDEERAAAWHVVDEDTTLAPGTAGALEAALSQVTGHRAYRKWLETGSHAGGARAEVRDGRLLVAAPNSYRYGPKDGSGLVSTVEFGYEDVGPILATVRRLAAG
ncbi:hypothetical protein [Streptomyces smyrnaeus]|uniref:hypothetical protein n=1 Tax=Streptomyces smyrnaeus TaxID=1387713 RepID=UPI00369FC32D